jgi:predicted DNA-binding protein (MmcQ/YjbR family)
MNIEELRNYCMNKKGVSEHFPFDSETLVFKVMDKIFLLTGINGRPLSFNVKCDPELAIELREKHEAVLPGYHMNKKHWNTVVVNGTLAISFLCELIDHSYDLVCASLGRKQKLQLKQL